ncbi:hypothetical protein H9P43_004372 [Blastocladiella emersonii ATCC 22665]|nr:hypothetical protein H9P43_004372 [Blastocladiella emersonii ATCC 22665]
MPRTLKALTVPVGISVGLSTALVIMGVQGALSPEVTDEIILRVNSTYAVYSIFDAVINAVISSLFVYHLHSIINLTSSHVKRRGLPELLRNVRIMLAAECILVVVMNIVRLSGKDWDPQFGGSFFAEAFRLRAFVSFLDALSTIMKRNTSSSQVSGGSTPALTRNASVKKLSERVRNKVKNIMHSDAPSAAALQTARLSRSELDM